MSAVTTDLMTSNLIRRATQNSSFHYAQSVRKVSSGANHVDFQTTGAQTNEILNIKQTQSGTEAFRDVTTALISRTGQHGHLIQSIFDLAVSYRVELQKSRTEIKATDLQKISTHYKDKLYQLLTTTDTKGRFILSGQASDLSPVVKGLKDILAPALNEELDPTTYATASLSKINAAVQQGGEKLPIGVVVDHPGIRSFIHALLIGEQHQAVGVNNTQDAAFMEQAIGLMEKSTANFADLIAELGYLQKFLEDIQTLHEKTLESSKEALSDIMQPDLLEVYQDAQIQQTLIKLLYKTSTLEDIDAFIQQLKL